MSKRPVILWFRRDLRLLDNPALEAARASGAPVLPLYILDDEGGGRRAAGAASRWWLHHSLEALQSSLSEKGSRLFLARGPSSKVLEAVVGEIGASALFWNRVYEPDSLARDGRIETQFGKRGVAVASFNGSLLFEPPAVSNRQGGPFKVFTPYWRHCMARLLPDDGGEIRGTSYPFPQAPEWSGSASLRDFSLLPERAWAERFPSLWTPGEKGAALRLKRFLADPVERYDSERDFPFLDGTSGLSPHLHFGELSPWTIWRAMRRRAKRSGVFPSSGGELRFLTELGWREFAHHLLFHFPDTPSRPLRSNFESFDWASDPGARKLHAWQKGRTGYPIVDAGMRQLWETGWMHNRVRMLVGSFLVKHLRLHWRLGAEWFWDTLVDADLANNTLGWQWIAGCGADAAPYFRIFNPILQGERFDADGAYVRRWIPELKGLSSEWIHRPFEAPSEVLDAAGLPTDSPYRRPIVEHRKACEAALAAFRSLKETRT